jgi:hypothetical protein
MSDKTTVVNLRLEKCDVRTLNEENARLTGRVEKLTQLSEFIGTKKL